MIKKLFYLSNLSFLLLYVVIAWHNRLALDDFHFMANVHQYGILKGTEVEYNFYSTRWLSVLVVHTVLSLMPYTHALFILSIVTIIFIVLSFSFLLKNIFRHFLLYKPGIFLLLNLSIFSVNAFFYSSLDIGNIWFWLSALLTYLWSFIFFLLGLGIIISSNKLAIIKLTSLSLSFFYIGGSAEAFAAVLLFALLIAIIWLKVSKVPFSYKKIYLTRLYLAFFFCITSLIILYLGHGNSVRQGLIGKISLFHAFILNIGTTGWIGIYWISGIVPFVLLFSLPLLYAGKILSLKNAISKESASEVRLKLFKAVLLYGILTFVLNYPITYLLCGLAPGRALAPVSFLTWVLFAFSFFHIGYKTSVKEKTVKNLAAIALGLCLLLNTYNAIHQFIVTREYAGKYDALMEELIYKKEERSIIVISKLPPSGILTSLDISKDSLAHNNIFLKTALGLKANIMLGK